jgi:glycosyltransferase involved in cell wall biosynthesis
LDWDLAWHGGGWGTKGTGSSGWVFASLRKEVANRGLEGRFRLCGAVEDARTVYANASAVIVPSFFEGCPNVVCEAMACGKAVLASRVGDIPQFVEEGINGLLFDPHCAGEIAQTVVRFCRLSWPERDAMGRMSRVKAERLFSMGRFAEQHEALL